MLVDYTTFATPDVPPALDFGATFTHAGGQVTSLAVVEEGARSPEHRSVTVLSGSAGGTVSALPVKLPVLAGATLADVHVRFFARVFFGVAVCGRGDRCRSSGRCSPAPLSPTTTCAFAYRFCMPCR